jgi:hypothetical protein
MESAESLNQPIESCGELETYLTDTIDIESELDVFAWWNSIQSSLQACRIFLDNPGNECIFGADFLYCRIYNQQEKNASHKFTRQHAYFFEISKTKNGRA